MAEIRTIAPARHGWQGEIDIPGDKSISHRSVMFAGLGNTPVHIRNFLHAEDCLSTVGVMRALGVDVKFLNENELIVTGNGLHGLTEPLTVLDAGNSGTTLRLMMGLLAPQPFLSVFCGDSSLTRRPMGRVLRPLSEMGAQIYGRSGNNNLPLTIVPTEAKLRGIHYKSPVASAQVKSAILLAGLYADAPTTVTEPYVSRDHTEQMLAGFGVHLERSGTSVTLYPVEKGGYRAPDEITVPGDISSAAFFLVAGSIIADSRLLLKNVGINPTRTGILDVLTEMGAHITLQNERMSGGERVADIAVEAAHLHGVSFGAEIMPRLIDEIPVLAVAALFAKGDTVITGAGELRVKETDRLRAIAAEFQKLAPGSIEEREDGLVIHGNAKIERAQVSSWGDHRMAMSLAVLGAAAEGVLLENSDSVNISYPTFFSELDRLS
ncbi:3-phosphoshikimate 1-carboxyvinyltransferase [Selenomonas sp. oral taxon 892 str. F0426]|uniref:3-phosphoshikimate 1-carboxyvinyltransferase n=1 Tax=Selenomonas sp. oral taxon 892 TaxID=1321785 RepID=UPI0003AD1643|nr:3-phosphoshikimate 1-carboxyvinyltransferase [Selenomonas sp. oral taxon 892]ERJ92998.1 3-phosphoshikimate 1-carboxyvinyltransferase [Selenomonas sp. oral taxon 892 str. F0426]